MQTNYTPGPWAFVQRHLNNSGTITGPDGGSVCAIASSVRRHPDEKLANAALIAAAPDLLAALQALEWAVTGVEYMEDEYAEQIAAARRAIARAIGGDA